MLISGVSAYNSAHNVLGIGMWFLFLSTFTFLGSVGTGMKVLSKSL